MHLKKILMNNLKNIQVFWKKCLCVTEDILNMTRGSQTSGKYSYSCCEKTRNTHYNDKNSLTSTGLVPEAYMHVTETSNVS
jgi:hypothetical protein